MRMRDAEKHNRKMAKTRERLLRHISRRGAAVVRCPNCGTELRTVPGQKESFCFGCCRPVDLAAAERDAMARAYRDGLSGYGALLSLGSEQLALSSFVPAEETFTAACAIDEGCGEAWRGLLASVTEEFHKEGQLPLDLYEKALSVLDEREARKLRRQWSAYLDYLSQLEDSRSFQRRTEQARQRNSEQQAEAAGAEGKQGRGRAIARALLITACLAGGLLLLFTGSGFMFIMGAAILSSLGRRRGQ